MSRSITNIFKTNFSLKIAGGITLALVFLLFAFAMMQRPVIAEEGLVVYKSPTCGCCADWITHMKESGFKVTVHNSPDVSAIKNEWGVPGDMRSCHTAKIGGYVVEGHVPADLVKKMLKERPQAKGLAVPGMPMGSPGMEGPRKDSYEVILFNSGGNNTVYANR